MCKSVGEYPGSSHHGYISSAKKWDWLYKEFLLGMFAEKKAIAKKKYLEFVTNEDSSEVTDFYSKKNLGTIFGTQDFIDWVKEKFYRVKSHAEIPQSRQLAPTIAEIKEKVCRCYGVEQQALEKSKRGQVNEPRTIAIYLARLTRSISCLPVIPVPLLGNKTSMILCVSLNQFKLILLLYSFAP
jgi:hypothetical protein